MINIEYLNTLGIPALVYEISKIQKQLSSTDYKIIKSYEYSLAGLELPYDIEDLNKERDLLRADINSIREIIQNKRNESTV